MPFIHDHGIKPGKTLLGIGLREQQGKAFRGGHQGLGQGFHLACTFAGSRVAGAHAGLPLRQQLGQRVLQGTQGIGGQGAHRGDPEYAQAARVGGQQHLHIGGGQGLQGQAAGSSQSEHGFEERITAHGCLLIVLLVPESSLR